jgi:zinc protease
MVNAHVSRRILNNQMTILVLPHHQIPKVSIQLWYNVGSKDEKSGEKGIAHLIEHMIFKGTTTLSESDINLITHKLSGACNAFTSHDYTGYLFDLPAQHWHEALPIMADCMQNSLFKEDLLNSELKAVIQELKMYNDDYTSTLIEQMLSSVFTGHPYRYPVIGYKQDLWSLKRDALIRFYKQYYVPHNATLVIVGDVDPEDAFAQAEKYFGNITSTTDIPKREFYLPQDIVAQSVTLYRDVQQPIGMVAWLVPGAQDRQDYVLDILSWILGSGKGSRLYRRIVEELELATDIETFVYDLFEYGLLLINFQSKDAESIPAIIKAISEEVEKLAQELPTQAEIIRAIKKTEMDFVSLTESIQKQAYLIGKYYLATGDENYLANYTTYPKEELAQAVQQMAQRYLRPTVMHQGKVLALPVQEQPFWDNVQERSDAEDARILARITRETPVEEGVHVKTITAAAPKEFNFPQAQKALLSNGLEILYYHNPDSLKVDIILDLKAKSYYDPEHLQGLQTFMMDMIEEGTTDHSAQEFAQILESYGMTLHTAPGQIALSLLSQDIPNGLDLLLEILTKATITPTAVEHVRCRLLCDTINFWDTPSQFAGQLTRQEVYRTHPYHKCLLGTPESIQAITQQDLAEAYHKFITPHEARLAIVGNLNNYNIAELLEEKLGRWHGPIVEDIEFPVIPPLTAHQINYRIQRDQVILCFGGISVTRYDQRYDKLLLFDQIFTGGVLGSMSSRLFELREQSGLFYTIGGSLLAGVHKQPGMVFIKTIVSQDRLQEAQKAIAHMIYEGASAFTQQELEEAQRALINSLVDNFASNRQMATAFLFLETFKFPQTYFDTRAQELLAVSLEDVKKAVPTVLCPDSLVTLRVGRV